MATATMNEERSDLLAKSRDIVAAAKSAGRELNADEVRTLKSNMDRVDEINDGVKHGEELKARLHEWAKEPDETVLPHLGKSFVNSNTRSWAEQAKSALEKHAGQFGIKAVIGSTITAPSIITAPVELVRPPSHVLELIPRSSVGDGNGQLGANVFNYLRQTVRTNNATAVADGGTKPTSVFTWDEVEGRIRVYAHLSEPVPERYFDDYATVLSLLQDEMARGIVEALENDVLNGPASASERFTGILNTSGVQTQAAVGTDLVGTLSAAYFKLVSQGDEPTGWILNPTDYARLTLLRENGTTGALLFGSGRSSLEQVIGSAPIVTSTKIAAGTALVGDFGKTTLVQRKGTSLQVDRSGTLFETNMVRLRVEGRFGFAVTRPASFVKTTLPA